MKDNRHKSKYFISCMSKHKINHHLIFFSSATHGTCVYDNDVSESTLTQINFSYFSSSSPHILVLIHLLLLLFLYAPKAFIHFSRHLIHTHFLYTHMMLMPLKHNTSHSHPLTPTDERRTPSSLTHTLVFSYAMHVC